MTNNHQMENELGRLILRLANTIIKNRNHHLEVLNLTTEQADTLQFFLSQPGATATQLKGYLGITHQTARGIVRRMVDKGLLELRLSDSDARCRRIFPTAKGEILGERMQANRERTGGKLLKGMTDAEQQDFLRLLKQSLNNVKHD